VHDTTGITAAFSRVIIRVPDTKSSCVTPCGRRASNVVIQLSIRELDTVERQRTLGLSRVCTRASDRTCMGNERIPFHPCHGGGPVASPAPLVTLPCFSRESRVRVCEYFDPCSFSVSVSWILFLVSGRCRVRDRMVPISARKVRFVRRVSRSIDVPRTVDHVTNYGTRDTIVRRAFIRLFID